MASPEGRPAAREGIAVKTPKMMLTLVWNTEWFNAVLVPDDGDGNGRKMMVLADDARPDTALPLIRPILRIWLRVTSTSLLM
jgi:hypothetical protein